MYIIINPQDKEKYILAETLGKAETEAIEWSELLLDEGYDTHNINIQIYSYTLESSTKVDYNIEIKSA